MPTAVYFENNINIHCDILKSLTVKRMVHKITTVLQTIKQISFTEDAEVRHSGATGVPSRSCKKRRRQISEIVREDVAGLQTAMFQELLALMVPLTAALSWDYLLWTSSIL
jgi:hypothetical protein